MFALIAFFSVQLVDLYAGLTETWSAFLTVELLRALLKSEKNTLSKLLPATVTLSWNITLRNWVTYKQFFERKQLYGFLFH